MLHIMIFLGLAGLVMKLYKPTESNMLFDGGSLVLFMCGVIVYITNVIKGIRTIHGGDYSNEIIPGERELKAGKPLAAVAGITTDENVYEGDLLGREDTMKVLAASNTILALVLVGVLALQAGQWYAEKKQREDEAKMDADDKMKGKDTPAAKKTVRREASGSKKKQ
jgi:ER membrane protein SH3